MLTDKTAVRNFLMNSLIVLPLRLVCMETLMKWLNFERPLSVFNTVTNTIDAFQVYNFV